MNDKFPVTPEMKVIEEMAELTHAICKAERFGWFNYHPDGWVRENNLLTVEHEIDDVREALDNLERKLRLKKEGK